MARLLLSEYDRAVMEQLADAVEDLVDGLGGDAQEQARGADIARALQAIADGDPVAPLVPHNAARRAYRKVLDAEHQWGR